MLAGGMAVLALTAATVFYVIQAFNPLPVAQTQQVNTGTSPEGYMTLRETQATQAIIDPRQCTTNVEGVTTTKQEAICSVNVDLHLYKVVRGNVGFCQDLDTTSPENNADRFVVSFKGRESLILALFTEAPEALPGITDSVPPISISGIDNTYSGVDCTALSADPN